MLQIGAASSLQIRASVVTNWGSCYKLGQPLLRNRAAITNWGKMYDKFGQVLQTGAKQIIKLKKLVLLCQQKLYMKSTTSLYSEIQQYQVH